MKHIYYNSEKKYLRLRLSSDKQCFNNMTDHIWVFIQTPDRILKPINTKGDIYPHIVAFADN